MICVDCNISMIRTKEGYLCPKCGNYKSIGGCPICGYPQMIDHTCVKCGFKLLLLEEVNHVKKGGFLKSP